MAKFIGKFRSKLRNFLVTSKIFIHLHVAYEDDNVIEVLGTAWTSFYL